MKKLIYLFGVLAVIMAFISCKDDEDKKTVDLIVGDYAFLAESIWSTAEENWDLNDTLTIEKVSETQVKIIGLIPYDSLGSGGGNMVVFKELTADVDLEAMQIKIPVGQQLTGPNGNGYYTYFYAGDPESELDWELDVTDDEYVVATIKENGDISMMGPWGIKWVEPDGVTFDGKWWWDFYTVTNMTKIK
ncbi:MAG: hypothetical protein JW973_12280 [Bacteroidales bacterium]|nr:hypothetical protein [Bacteroidales bacterium]